MSHIRKNNGKTSAPHKVHIIKKETLLTFLEGYSKCQRGLSPVVLNFVAGEAVCIFCLSRPIELNVKSSPVKQMLCLYIIRCVVQPVRVALFCIKTIPRFALLCEIATGWRCGFDPSQQTSFDEVFVCINIPTHIVIGPPPNCPIFLTDYSPSLFCDTHGSVHLIGANWISWTNSTPICTGVPKMTSCPR